MKLRSIRTLAAGIAVTALALSSFANAPSPSSAPRSARALEPAPELATIPIERLPLALHRRAARHLEVMRQTSDSAWFQARLGERAMPMLHPGVSGVAHYEVPVVAADGSPLGYVLLSTGEHEAPIVGSASGGRPASEQLVEMAAAQGKSVARIWVLAPFSFVAEDARGQLVAQLGTLPPRIEGIDPALLDLPEAQRRVRVAYDGSNAPRLQTPAAVSKVKTDYWSSWAELSAAFSEPDSILAEIARRNAAPFWKLEHEIETLPARLDQLELTRVPLLRRGRAELVLQGPGAQHVAAERVDGPNGDAWVNLRVASSPERVAPVSVEVAYASGERELIGFAVPARTPKMPRAVFAQTFASTCKKVALRTQTGHYVRVEQGGIKRVDAQAQRVGPWEIFLLEQVTGGKVALRQASSGAYIEPLKLSATAPAGGGGLTAIDGSRKEAHLFTPVDGGGGRFAFKTQSGHYLTAVNGGGGAMQANRTTVGTSEKFLVLCNPPSPTVYFADNRDEPSAWAAQRKYYQLKGGEGGNTSSCASGCGATAWAMLVGYGDYMASLNVTRWAPYKRLYLQGGARGKLSADAVAPEWQDAGINKITLEIRNAMGDFGAGCSPTGERFTMPHIMAQGSEYFWGRVPARVNADYDGAYISTAAGVAKVKATLQNVRKPIGIGVGYHYPVGWGLRSATPPRWSPTDNKWVDFGTIAWFIDANYGWGQAFSHSVPLQSWFHGELVTAPYSRVSAIASSCTLRAKAGGPTGRVDRDYKCTTQFQAGERHVAMEVAQTLIEKDVLPAARASNLRVCLLRDTDIQCAPCSTTDRLIVRMDLRSTSCPSGTVNAFR